MNKILYNTLTFENKDIVEGNCYTQHAMAGESLASDTLDFQVWAEADADLDLKTGFDASDGELITSDSKDLNVLTKAPLTEFNSGDPVLYYFNNVLINKFYLNDVKRVGPRQYNFNCVSAIGLLENSMHYGGIYTGTPITTVLAEILDGMSYTVDSVVATIKLYGWLPYATKRDNLNQITIATALAIKTMSDGTLRITSLSSQNAGTFDNDRTVVGGSVDVVSPCTAVQVVEHMFSEAAETITLLNESFLTQKLVVFPEPVHDLAITGGTILSSGANHAVVQGSGAVLLTGKKYLHTIKRITEGSVTGGINDKVLSVESATLVTSLNSSAVAKKLYEAFSKTKVIKSDVLYGDERPGDVVDIINPYTAVQESAMTKKMAISMSGYLKASAEFIADYAPSGVITGYQNRVILTSGSSWTIPAGVEEIRAVLVGGGQGGQGGLNGSPGGQGTRLPSTYRQYMQTTDDYITEANNGNGGEGGAAGQGGLGGKVLDTGPLMVTPGAAISYSLGTGGPGGSPNGGLGSLGGNTTFGAFSSASGSPVTDGYVDIFNAEIYGISGFQGYPGEKGSGKDNPSHVRVIRQAIGGGAVYYIYNGYMGASEWAYFWIGDSSNTKYGYGMGGSGGGGAFISNGATGGPGNAEVNNGYGFVDGGTGGNGANGSAGGSATIFGSGGHGGHGGGGGGGGGGYVNPNGDTYEWPGAGGPGGSGGAGGNGKSGCIIIYY